MDTLLRTYGFTEQGFTLALSADKLALVAPADRDINIYETLPPIPGMVVRTIDEREYIIETVKTDGDYPTVDTLTSLSTGDVYIPDDYVLMISDVPETSLGRAWLDLHATRGLVHDVANKLTELEGRLQEIPLQSDIHTFLDSDTHFINPVDPDSVPMGDARHVWVNKDNTIIVSYTKEEGLVAGGNIGAYGTLVNDLQYYAVNSGLLDEYIDLWCAYRALLWWLRRYDTAYDEMIEQMKSSM